MNSSSEKALAEFTFRIMQASLSLYEKLSIPVISTTRPFRFYRKVLFNDQHKTALQQTLQGKVLVDVGCGLTPFIEDSMFQWCRRRNIDFYGVDPKVKDGFRFGLFDRLKSIATGARTAPNPNIAGQEKTIATFANALPFDDASVDTVLSCWLIFSWIRDDELLTDIFKEFDRILKPGGSIRLFPTPHIARICEQNPQLGQLLADYQSQQQFLYSVNVMSLPPAFATQLVKPHRH